MLVFLNLFLVPLFLYKGPFFCEKTFFIRVDRRVIGVKAPESDVSFLKFFFEYHFFRQRTIFLRKSFLPLLKGGSYAERVKFVYSYVRSQVKQTFSYNSSFSIKFDQWQSGLRHPNLTFVFQTLFRLGL